MNAEYQGNEGFLQRDSVEHKEYAEVQSTDRREGRERDGASDLLEAILDRNNLFVVHRFFEDEHCGIVKLVVHAKHIVSIPDKVKCFRKLMIDFLLLLDELERLHEGFFRYHFSPSSSLAFISHAMASSCVSGSTSHSRKRTINRSTVHPRGVMISLI